MTGAGLRFHESTELTDRALAALRRSPRSTDELAREVLGLRNAPDRVTEQLLDELLGGDDRVRRGDAGTWRLAGGGSGEKAAPEASLRDLEYSVVDVETTGTAPSSGDRVTEIAIVQVSGGEVTGELSTLVDPGVPIPDSVVELTGITEEMVDGAPAFEEVADRVRSALAGRVFVAHNASFDWRFLRAEMERARSLTPTGPRLCTVRLARRALPGLSRRGLDAVARYYGLEIEGRHRAAGDARATATILRRLLEEAARAGVRRWAELDRWLGGEASPADTSE